MWVLFVVGLACNIVGCEFEARRIETLALLPASLSKLWTSKAVFVGVMLVAFLAWTLGSQFATFLAFDSIKGRPGDFAEFLRKVPVLASYALPLTVIALLVSTLVEKSLPALFLTLIVAGGVISGSLWLLRWLGPVTTQSSVFELSAGAALTLAFTAISARTFVAGRVHTQARWRKWAVATSSLGILVLAVAAVAGWRVWSWKRMAPGDDGVVVNSICASPDGRWVAVQAMKYVGGDFRTSGVWTIPTDGGEIVACDDSNWLERNPWNADGTLRTAGHAGATFHRQSIDPSTGEPRSAETYDPRTELHSGDDEIYPYWAGPRTGVAVLTGKKATRNVTWKARGIERRIETVGFLGVCRLPGVVWYSPDGLRVVRLDFATGEERAVFDSPTPIARCWPSQDGARLLVQSGPRTHLLDAATGATVCGPWESLQVAWPDGSFDDGRFVRAPLDGRDTIVDTRTGRTVELAKAVRLGQFGYVCVAPLADGRLVLLDQDGAIDLYDEKGAPVRRLYTPKGN
jgi:hypothetical protein